MQFENKSTFILNPVFAGLLAVIVIIILFSGFEYLEKQRFHESLRVHTINQLSHIRASLEAEINADIHLTRGLIAYVAIQSTLEPDTLHHLSRELLRHRNNIRNIGLAPDNILSFIHPVVGNEQAIGLNYSANKEQWPAVKRAIEDRKTVVAGPVNLVQGGTAFISRTPIYTVSSLSEQEGERYWGLASIVIDQQKLFQAAGFDNPDLEIRIAIRGADGLGEKGEFIDGEQRVFNENPVLLDVHLPEGSWQLGAIPHDGWETPSPYLGWLRSGGIIVSLLTGLGIYFWLQMQLQSHRRLEEEQKKTEEAKEILTQNEKFLNAIVENIPHMIFVKDAEELRFIRFNKAGVELVGYPRDELIGKNDYDFFPKEEADFFTKKDKEVLKNKQLLNIPSEPIQTRNKGTRLLHTIKIPILNEQNESEYLLGISEDITEQIHSEKEKQKLEKQLHLAQRMEAIGLMAGGVAHDLNNILSGIVSYPELLLLDIPENSKLRQPIEAIQQSGQRAAAVVSDLITVARGAIGVREPHNLNSIVQEYLDSPEFQKLKTSYPKVKCIEQLEAESSTISCSPIHIKKVLMNLVMNAAEAIRDSGDINITTSNECIDKSIGAGLSLKDGRYVVLGVSDTGPGIASKDLSHIFEPFYTKKVMGKSGTGLGLAVVWNAVQDHSGKIFVGSNKNGTHFRVYLPVTDKKIESIARSEDKPDFLANGEHVLVVDDEPHLRDIACQMLRSLGYRVDSVSSGELAVKFVTKTPVDLLLIDMLMDPGMNGRRTYEEIIKLYPDQKAVIVSGFAESDDVRTALSIGAGAFIKKPYTIDQLGQAVKTTLIN